MEKGGNLAIAAQAELDQKTQRYLEMIKTMSTVELGEKKLGDVVGKLLAAELQGNTVVKRFYVWRTKIGHETAEAIAEALKVNRTLEEISLSWNRLGFDGIKSLADALRVNTKLWRISISLWNNKIGNRAALYFFEALSSNSTLRHVRLREGHICITQAKVIAAAMSTTSSIKALCLRYNQVDDESMRCIVDALATNPHSPAIKLSGIELSKYTAALSLPSEFAQKSNHEILEYLRELQQEPMSEMFRMKVMLVGPGEAGKTTLLNHFMSGKFVPSEGMTDGVAMRTWSPQLPAPESLQEEPQHSQSCSVSSELKIQLSIWDFGGQEVYLNTHPILFTDKTLYLLVWNPRSRTTVATLEDYILNIRSRDASAPILFVTTHRAEVHDREVRRVLIDLEKHNFIGHISVDSVTGEGLQELKQTLVRLVTVDYSHFSRALIPTWYLHLESVLRERSFSQFSMNRIEFLNLCRSSASRVSLSASSTDTLLFLLHHWGVVFVLPDPNLTVGGAESNLLSSGDIVLDPQRLADVLRAVISCHRLTAGATHDLQESGVLNHALAPLIWPTYEPHLCRQFLVLLHSSELAYEIYDSLGHSTHQSLVPALLPHSRRLTEREIRERIGSEEVGATVADCLLLRQGFVRVSFNCLLPNFFPKLVIRLRHLCCASQISRSSFTIRLPLWEEREQALRVSAACVVEDKDSNSLTFYPAGRSLDATAICFQTISSLLLSTFPGLRIEELLLATPGRLFGLEEITGRDSLELLDGSKLSLRFLAPLLTSVSSCPPAAVAREPTSDVANEEGKDDEGDCLMKEQLSESEAITLAKLEEKLTQFQSTSDICDRLSLSRALLDAAPLFRRVGFEFDAEPKVLWLAAGTGTGTGERLISCRLYAVSPSVSPCLPWEIVWETEITLPSPPSPSPSAASLSELYLASLTCLFPNQRLPPPPSPSASPSEVVTPLRWIGVVPCLAEESVVAVREMESHCFASERDMFGTVVLYSKDLLARERRREGAGEEQMREIVRGEVEAALGDLAVFLRR